jgi:hypothetical protein
MVSVHSQPGCCRGVSLSATLVEDTVFTCPVFWRMMMLRRISYHSLSFSLTAIAFALVLLGTIMAAPKYAMAKNVKFGCSSNACTLTALHLACKTPAAGQPGNCGGACGCSFAAGCQCQ